MRLNARTSSTPLLNLLAHLWNLVVTRLKLGYERENGKANH